MTTYNEDELIDAMVDKVDEDPLSYPNLRDLVEQAFRYGGWDIDTLVSEAKDELYMDVSEYEIDEEAETKYA